ncbi:MAG: DUF3289 family protein [Pedobacter sp.]|uniref:DUF3289 family protein n=1 Tax=Pedobacter sp. TaxID=1411316 RepID=UPI002806CBA4|nr:DUF3289 family protein [Pedobacter sp.]MDQ8003308.1 DUF3289 family protein [Pedobacter sp.]
MTTFSMNEAKSFASVLKTLLFSILAIFIFNSCKKEILTAEIPVSRPEVVGRVSVKTIDYRQFLSSIQLKGTGKLEEVLNSTPNGSRQINTSSTNILSGLAIDADSVKRLAVGDTVSYILRLSNKGSKSAMFHNLTLQQINGVTKAFITTYKPTKYWIDNWKKNRSVEFNGLIRHMPIDLNGNVNTQNKNDTRQVQSSICTSYTVYIFIDRPCTGTGDNMHWPGEPCQNDGGPGAPYVDMIMSIAYECGGGGGGNGDGGGGSSGYPPNNTTPTPPENYDPCSAFSDTGEEFLIPCSGDGNSGQPLTAAQQLIIQLEIADAHQMNLLNNDAMLVLQLQSYLNANGNSIDSKNFASWAVAYLTVNTGFDYHIFFDANEFSGINNPPANITEEPLINNGIEIGNVPDNAPQNQNRVIGSAPKRHGNNPEDLQYGTNGNTAGIFSTQISLPTQTLFSNMRDLMWKTSILSPEMRTVTGLMIDRFENNIGGTFENATLTAHVKQSVQYQNFLRRFGERLSGELTEVNGNIDNVIKLETNDIRPIFNSGWNKFSGLQIAINDTEAHEIKLLNFKTEGGVLWSADVEVTIIDHFGLDKADALKYQAKHRGFAAWWLLQHTRAYKPFVTKVVIKSSVGGRY